LPGGANQNADFFRLAVLENTLSHGWVPVNDSHAYHRGRGSGNLGNGNVV
jgi:hypothetical protein